MKVRQWKQIVKLPQQKDYEKFDVWIGLRLGMDENLIQRNLQLLQILVQLKCELI